MRVSDEVTTVLERNAYSIPRICGWKRGGCRGGGEREVDTVAVVTIGVGVVAKRMLVYVFYVM